MIFEQHYLDCLSQASYLIGDETTGRAVVVDPRRDVAVYLDSAAGHGVTIELVVETHFHADFLSGHLELAEATGAPIVYGEAAEADFAVRHVADGERHSLGEVTLEFLATPGHTPESISVVVYEHPDDEVPYGVLTGDTLFIGDVGRPDLLASVGVTAEDLARQLHSSLHDKLMRLPDATRVFPAHGAGSACGRNLSTDTQSTIGEQRLGNYAVQPMSADEFVRRVTEGQPLAPGYFGYDADLNRRDRALFDEAATAPALALGEVRVAQAAGAVVLDTRDGTDFAVGHLAGSINVGADGRFAEYAGSVVDHDTDVVLVTEPGAEHEAQVRLGRIGYDHVIGHLDDPVRAFSEHPDSVERSSRLSALQLAARRDEVDDLVVVDVRNAGELEHGRIEGSVHIPVASLAARISELDPSAPTVVHCAGGYRSILAASYLTAHGFDDVSDLLGGYAAWSDLDETGTSRT
jgi:hydroxyacylglutathione hydrolase